MPYGCGLNKMVTGLLALIGIGGGALGWIFGFGSILKTVLEVITPILKVLVSWLMDLLDFLVRRFISEVKALFDVFPFMVLSLVFLLGALTFASPKEVYHKAAETIQHQEIKKQPRYKTSIIKKTKRILGVRSPFRIPGID